MAIMAAPLTAREAAMAQATKADFEKAAAGREQPGGSSDGKKSERPQADHNLEPSIQDKKAGASLDKAPSRERYERIRDTQAARNPGRDHSPSR